MANYSPLDIDINFPELNDLVPIEDNTPKPREMPQSKGLGTAQFGETRKLVQLKDTKGLFYLSNEDPNSDEMLGLHNDFHVLCVGATRSLKGVSVIVPNLLHWHGSALVVDIKGELATVTARRRSNGSRYCSGIGQRVFIIDPLDQAGRDDDPMFDLKAQFNPLKGLDPKDPRTIDLVNEIASSMIFSNKQEGDESYWLNASRSLLKAVILHVISFPDFEEEDRNLVIVYQLLCHGDREKKAFLEDIGADDVSKAHTLLFKAMELNSAFGGIVANAGETYVDMIDTASRQYLGVLETLKSNLEFMDSPGIQECLLDSDFTLDDLKADPNGITVYLCLPLGLLDTHFRWLRILITQAMNRVERQKFQPKSGWPVLFVMDEFAALKKMATLQNGIAQMAGHGIKFLIAIQDFGQLKTVYNDAWETFIANCGVKLFLGNTDVTTAEYASKLVGDVQVAIRNNNSSNSTSDTTSHTFTHSTATGMNLSDAITIGSNRGTANSFGPGLFAFSSSNNRGLQVSNTHTKGSSHNTSKSNSDGFSQSKSITHGVQINWQSRPLVKPEEIGRFFSAQDEEGGLPYAGHSLLLVAGQHPIAIRRTLYYRHICFEGLFDPHWDFPVSPAYTPPPVPKPLPATPLTVSQPLVIPGLPTKEDSYSLWQKIARWVWKELKQTVIEGTHFLFTKRLALWLFWMPSGSTLFIGFMFYLLGILDDVFLLMLSIVLALFPFLAGV